MRLKKGVWFGLWVLVSLSCQGVGYMPEMTSAYEQIEQVTKEASMTGDITHLSEVLTQDALFGMEKELKKEVGKTVIKGPDTYVQSVWVNSYNPPEAIITVNIAYRRFYLYNRQTKELTYKDQAGQISHVFKIRMYQENGVWKEDKTLEFMGAGN